MLVKNSATFAFDGPTPGPLKRVTLSMRLWGPLDQPVGQVEMYSTAPIFDKTDLPWVVRDTLWQALTNAVHEGLGLVDQPGRTYWPTVEFADLQLWPAVEAIDPEDATALAQIRDALQGVVTGLVVGMLLALQPLDVSADDQAGDDEG